jgi:heme-degrading monooxygenase HmoA
MVREYSIVMVVWRDTEAMTGWQKFDEIKAFTSNPNSIMKTVGWLVYQDDNHVVVAQTCGEYAVAELTKIPVGCIEDIFKMQKPDENSITP